MGASQETGLDLPEKEQVHAIGMRVERTLGIELAEIEFTKDGMTVVCGDNGSGKTSLTKAFWYAMGGHKPKDIKPIKDGADSGLVLVHLESTKWGKLTVEYRAWFKKKQGETEASDEWTHKVKVFDEKGRTLPEDILKEIHTNLSIDPTALLNITGKERLAMLTAVVDIGIDLDVHAARYKGAYDERTANNRILKTAKAKVSTVDFAGVPDVEISVTALSDEIEKAIDHNRQQGVIENEFTICGSDIEECEAEIQRLTSSLKAKKVELKTLEETHKRKEAAVAAFTPTDIEALRDKRTIAEATNVKVRAKMVNADYVKDVEDAEAITQKLTAELKALDKEKADALAKVKFPIKGLTIDDGDIVFEGIPFGQINTAKQIEIALSILAAINPTLRFITCDHGSELDNASLMKIDEWGKAHGIRLLATMVRSDSKSAIELRDGLVFDQNADNEARMTAAATEIAAIANGDVEAPE